jgi:hypothetical protein
MSSYRQTATGLRFRGKALAAATMLALPLVGLLQEAWADSVGTVKISRGSASIERMGQKLPAPVGAVVESGDRIITGADSSVGITLRDNTMLSAGPNSTLDLNKYAFDATTHAGELDATIKRGSLAVISGKLAKANPDGVKFSSGTMTLGVRGTEFVIEAGQEE